MIARAARWLPVAYGIAIAALLAAGMGRGVIIEERLFFIAFALAPALLAWLIAAGLGPRLAPFAFACQLIAFGAGILLYEAELFAEGSPSAGFAYVVTPALQLAFLGATGLVGLALRLVLNHRDGRRPD